MLNTQKRYGNTGKKMITLTHEGREQIQTFADAHGMSFSATIESLALIDGRAYAATWCYVRTTTTESRHKDGTIVRHDPPHGSGQKQ